MVKVCALILLLFCVLEGATGQAAYVKPETALTGGGMMMYVHPYFDGVPLPVKLGLGLQKIEIGKKNMDKYYIEKSKDGKTATIRGRDGYIDVTARWEVGISNPIHDLYVFGPLHTNISGINFSLPAKLQGPRGIKVDYRHCKESIDRMHFSINPPDLLQVLSETFHLEDFLRGKLDTLVDGFIGRLKDDAEKAEGFVKGIYDRIRHGKRAVPFDLVPRTTSKRNFIDWAKKAGQSVSNSVKHAAQDVGKWTVKVKEGIRHAGHEIAEDVKQIHETAHDMRVKTQDDIAEWAKHTEQWFEHASADTKEWFEHASDDTKKFFQSEVKDVIQWADKAGHDMQEWTHKAENWLVHESEEAMHEFAEVGVKALTVVKKMDGHRLKAWLKKVGDFLQKTVIEGVEEGARKYIFEPMQEFGCTTLMNQMELPMTDKQIAEHFHIKSKH